MSDMILEEVGQLELHAQNQLSGRVRNLRLVIRENSLILRGHAHTYYAKQLAQHAVMQRTQLSIQANEIQVT